MYMYTYVSYVCIHMYHMYVYICMHMSYVCIHMYPYVLTHICIHMYAYVSLTHPPAYVYICIHLCIYMRQYIQGGVQTWIVNTFAHTLAQFARQKYSLKATKGVKICNEETKRIVEREHWRTNEPCGSWRIFGSRARLRENPQFSAQPKQSISNVIVIFISSGKQKWGHGGFTMCLNT